MFGGTNRAPGYRSAPAVRTGVQGSRELYDADGSKFSVSTPRDDEEHVRSLSPTRRGRDSEIYSRTIKLVAERDSEGESPEGKRITRSWQK